MAVELTLEKETNGTNCIFYPILRGILTNYPEIINGLKFLIYIRLTQFMINLPVYMSPPINFTNKSTVAAYIDTMVIEAGRYLGAKESINSDNKANAEVFRPYNNVMTAIRGTLINAAQALFTQKQVQAARDPLKLSENYVTAAFELQGWHINLMPSPGETPLVKTCRKISILSTRVEDIDNMRKRKAINYSICGILSLIGTMGFAMGVSASSQWLKTIGKIVGFVTLAYYVYRWISHRGDKERIMTEYLAIGKLGEKIRYDLTYYDEKMKLTTAQLSKYAPLFSDFVDENYSKASPTEIP